MIGLAESFRPLQRSMSNPSRHIEGLAAGAVGAEKDVNDEDSHCN